MSRQDLVLLPLEFALDRPENPRSYLEAAALIYQEISRDPVLAKSYGDSDLTFLQRIKTPELVLALVQAIREDGSLHIVNVGEIFRSNKTEDIHVTDDDVQVLTESLPLSVGFDLGFCAQLTNEAVFHISRLENIRIVGLEGCIGLTDGCLDPIADMNYLTLEVLSVAGNKNITDMCFKKIVAKCKALTSLNVSGCPLVSHDVLVELLQANRKLSTLKASSAYITDGGMSQMVNFMSAKYLTCLDISFCRDISDFGILSLAEKCTSITSLNLCGLNRVTDDGARMICANLWSLKALSLEDMFLLNDSAFWFDRVKDGRPMADDRMLTSLTTLNLRDCINVTDGAMQGLGERCRQVESLVLRGCEKLTGQGLRALTLPARFQVGFCDTLKSLDLSYCSALSAGALVDLVQHCGCLEDLHLDGLIFVDDTTVQQICLSCKTITRLSLQRCQQVTDAALCSIVDYLWLERIDLSHCTRITDAGIEVLALVCIAMQEVILRRCSKLTGACLFSLARTCLDLRELDVRDCAFIDKEAIEGMQKFLPLAIKIK
jgi:hypothetical protein